MQIDCIRDIANIWGSICCHPVSYTHLPIQCEYYALEGLSQLIHTIELVRERLNPLLEMEGVVFTMYLSLIHIYVLPGRYFF